MSDVAELGESEAAYQIEEICQAVLQLQRMVGLLAERPPVQMSVAHMAVQHLAFNVAGIDVEELSGQLNLGMTHLLQLARPTEGTDNAAPEEPAAAEPPPPVRSEERPEQTANQLWPPDSEEDEQA